MRLLVGIAICCIMAPLAAKAADKDGFLTEWLVSGPYPNYQVDGHGTAFDTDFLKGEADIVPSPGLKSSVEFVADWGKLVAGVGSTNEWGFRETKTFDTTWKMQSSPTFKVSFDKTFEPIDDYFGVYAVCWIESPDQRKIELGVGSDDDHKVYLNGKLVGKHNGSQATIPDQFVYGAVLQPGLNRLFFKLVDRTGPANFCLRLLDVNKKPMNDLIFYTDHPGRRFNAELFQNGYAANLGFETPHLFSGEQKLTVSVFTDKTADYSLRLNGKPVEAGSTTVQLVNGDNLLKLEVLEKNQVVAVMQRQVVAYSKESLAAENESLRQEIQQNAELISAMKAKRQTLEEKLQSVLQERKRVYAELEQQFAAQRAEACRDAKPSIDEPLTPATVRSRLCINGPWEASTDGKQWSEFALPAAMYNDFFRTWFNPVKNVDPKNHYGKVTSLPGWEDFAIHPVTRSAKASFRKSFTADGKSAVTLVCTGVLGRLQVFLNGEKCGEYCGRVGILEFPLNNCKVGQNVLQLDFEFTRQCGVWNGSYGIVGDLYLDFTSPVKMLDVWAKPSWRKATLSLASEIENRTDQQQEAEIRQYAARDGRVTLRLPVVKQTLPPHRTVAFQNSEKWANPLLWGIGGEYGNPDMYDLVSDVYVGGKLVDRHVQPFGFREFWIHATDFYLNGRRIVLQGDLGFSHIEVAKYRDIIWPLLRTDGINTFRFHDSHAQWCQEVANAADRMGMFCFIQMYPILFEEGTSPKPDNFPPFEEWTKAREHQYNLENYRRWFRVFRNNPSVVIWSTDNEIYTQAWDTAAKLEYNIRNDKVGSLYEKYMKTLDPDLVMTRDGDIGTWSHRGRWFEDPPCDTANYHYPEHNAQEQIVNWQKVYDYRPLIFGETLYNAYFQKEGATPDLISMRAKQVRQIGGMYRELEVPGQIFMGLCLDGFTIYDDSGKGNPWGITKTMQKDYRNNGVIPPMMKPDQYPWFRVEWPACSGKGRKDVFGGSLASVGTGCTAINWFDPKRPSHVRNAVNDAYQETLLPQPPLRQPAEGECIVVAKPNEVVWCVAADGARCGVQADHQGKAWFQLPHCGEHTFAADGATKQIDVPSRAAHAASPGFKNIPVFDIR